MERQVHGFYYEQQIINKYNLTKSTGYTDKYDCYCSDGTPVQVKCIKHNSSIDLGDYFRNKTKTEDFILIIGFWKKERHNIVEEHILYVNKDVWNNLFQFEYDYELKQMLRLITNERSDDVKWKQQCKQIKGFWNTIPRFVQLRFKRDHKKQKRIQCAINKKNFYGFFIEEFKWEKKNILTNFTPN